MHENRVLKKLTCCKNVKKLGDWLLIRRLQKMARFIASKKWLSESAAASDKFLISPSVK
jgi:hypothetical protein